MDLQKPEVLWQRDTGGKIFCDMAVDGGRVYVGNQHGHIIAIDASWGKKLWDRKIVESGIYADLLVQHGRIYTGSMNGEIHAVDALTGEKRWRYDGGFIHEAAPIIEDGVLYVGSSLKFFALPLSR